MTYLGESGEASAVLRADAPSMQMNPNTGTKATFVAPGSVTRGEFGLFRWDMPAGAGGAGAHFHRTFSESFYVMSGVVTFYNGEKWLDVSEGGFLYVPPGGLHGFANNADVAASMLILFAPGIAREEYFEELADIRTTEAVLMAVSDLEALEETLDLLSTPGALEQIQQAEVDIAAGAATDAAELRQQLAARARRERRG